MHCIGLLQTCYRTQFVDFLCKIPLTAKEAGIQGTVYVYFVVGKDGFVRDARVLRKVNNELDAEALRVVNSLPQFEPGTQRGKNVSVQYTIPIRYMIRSND